MDTLDCAAEYEALERQSALNQHLNRIEHPQQIKTDRPGGGFDVLCIDCFQIIPPRRLAVLPEAARCVDCQELYERY